jgi:predicted DCC family thiol-disulfide oxidoreductase YuxK
MEKPLVIYDGDCAFCSSSVRFSQRLIKTAPKMEPHQFLDLAQYGTTTAECDKAIHFIAADGKISVAHEAVRQLFLVSGMPWKLLGYLMRTPGIYQISGIVYRWVATNRHKLPGGTPTCKPKYLN